MGKGLAMAATLIATSITVPLSLAHATAATPITPTCQLPGYTAGAAEGTGTGAVSAATGARELTGRFDAAQIAHAQLITNVAHQLRLPERAAVIAVATALQESSLRNLPGGDCDSAGLFQQRPSAGWGTYEQVTSPVYAAASFTRDCSPSLVGRCCP